MFTVSELTLKFVACLKCGDFGVNVNCGPESRLDNRELCEGPLAG